MKTREGGFPVIMRNDDIPAKEEVTDTHELDLSVMAQMIDMAATRNPTEHVFYVAHVRDDSRVIRSAIEELKKLKEENKWLKQRS